MDQQTGSPKNKMEKRSHRTVWTCRVKISQALQTPVGSIQGGVPLSRVNTDKPWWWRWTVHTRPPPAIVHAGRFVQKAVARENTRFTASLFAAGDVSRGGRRARWNWCFRRQKRLESIVPLLSWNELNGWPNTRGFLFQIQNTSCESSGKRRKQNLEIWVQGWQRKQLTMYHWLFKLYSSLDIMTRRACLSPFQIPFYTMNLHTKTQNEGINVQFQVHFCFD